jgi:hypothetical protein
VRVAGADLFVTLSAALLPSRGPGSTPTPPTCGRAWGAGNNNQISDFAPDNSNIGVRTHPRAGDHRPRGVSGKIVRRMLKAEAMGADPGDLSTLAD